MKIKVLLFNNALYLTFAYIRDLQPFTFEGHINTFLKSTNGFLVLTLKKKEGKICYA